MPLVKVAIAFSIGIIIGNLTNDSLSHHKEFLIFLIGYSILSCRILKKLTLLKSVHWLSIFLLCGVLHYHFTSLIYQVKHFSNVESEIIGFRVEDINQTKSGLRLLSSVEYAGHHPDSLYRVKGRLMVYTKGVIDSLSTGDLIIARDKSFLEKANTNPHVFDYKNYLNHRAIYHRMHIDSSEYILTENHNLSILQEAGKIREKCLLVLQNHLSDANLAVAAAMILGERKLLDDELYDAFTDTGAVHVLAVSGLHVGIVSSIIFFAFKFFNRNSRMTIYTKVVLSITSVWTFAMLTGMAAAVTRAGIMFTLLLIGQALLRKTNSFNILACAAMIMLAYDPHYLFQAGFQFSFLALIGILYFYKPISRLFVSQHSWLNKVWGLIAVSISAQLLVSPLAIFYFHKLPNYFWLTGIVAVPAAFAILTLGLSLLGAHFLLGSASIATQSLGSVLEFTIKWFNNFIFGIQQIPFCSADNLWLSRSSLVLIYSALLLLSFYMKFKKPKIIIMMTATLLAQSVLHISEKRYEHQKDVVFIYDSYRSSIIDIYKNGYANSIHQDDMDDKQISYINKNNRLYHRIAGNTNLSEMNIDTMHNLMNINNHLILLYPTQINLKYCMSDSIDLAILSETSYNNIDKLTKLYPVKKFVLDGTIKNDKYWLRNQIEAKGIPTHLTSMHGAYAYYLN